MEPTIYVYGLLQESDGHTLEDLGHIIQIYQDKRRGVYCIETQHEFFKVDRSGKKIIPATRDTFAEIVLSYDYTFINGQPVTGDDYVQLTDVYKLNIQDIMRGTGGLGSI